MSSTNADATAAPADAIPREPRSLAHKILAYVILATLAGASIYLIDRKARGPTGNSAAAEATTPRRTGEDDYGAYSDFVIRAFVIGSDFGFRHLGFPADRVR